MYSKAGGLVLLLVSLVSGAVWMRSGASEQHDRAQDAQQTRGRAVQPTPAETRPGGAAAPPPSLAPGANAEARASVSAAADREGSYPDAPEGVPETRFGSYDPKDFWDATPEESLQAARTAPTVLERMNALMWLGHNASLDYMDAIQQIQMRDPDDQVRLAAERAAGKMRERFAEKPWPGIPEVEPRGYMKDFGTSP